MSRKFENVSLKRQIACLKQPPWKNRDIFLELVEKPKTLFLIFIDCDFLGLFSNNYSGLCHLHSLNVMLLVIGLLAELGKNIREQQT